MSSRSIKEKSSDPDPALAVIRRVDRDGAPRRNGISRLPQLLKLPLLMVLSLNLSAVLYSLSAMYLDTDMDFAVISRSMESEDWWDGLAMAGTLVGWRMFEVALAWFEGYDSYDVAALTLLSHAPPMYLLGTFYGVRPATVLSALIIDVLTMSIPLRLLRLPSPMHSAFASATSSGTDAVPNTDILTDSSIQTLTTVLAASIYGTVLYCAYAFGLPVYLVTYFSDIPSVEAAHASVPITLIPLVLPLGYAAKTFIFTPAAASAPSAADAKNSAFNPATATLGETFWYNVWGYQTRTKTVIRRTATLMLVSGVNTLLRTWMPIAGVEVAGAAAYSTVWVVAALTTGAALGLVCAV
ncbi:Uncharacterized protein BP5553_00716 [Venustampulla echinocandica]|uniref:Uncharacterized protein n=1 Tax=Venustampulla echinocandica TaxID=2656787 RepID=A0A370TYY0_9HELO|nr:Uncharacterized protein BP5553_00716 [Venustampulla echinocandica]RDL40737.1 Uncharacterized protein BP5553_00716 [Venustampulla echinocandica]